jgi:2'-5' RNA ligase
VFDDSEKAALVANINSTYIQHLHDICRGMGLQHSYSEFNPHVTLRYNMDPDEARAYADHLNGLPVPSSGFHHEFKLDKIKSEKINENYI